MDAAIATTCSIIAVAAFFGAIGTTIALAIRNVHPRPGLISIAGLVILGAVLIGIAVGVSH